MNRLGDVRQTLTAALEPVLPGRVQPYPPASSNGMAAPAVWVDIPGGVRTTIGERTPVLVATYPISIVYDGADRAQVAGLDDIVSKVVDAIAGCRGADVARWRRLPIDPNSNRRMVVVEVDVTITATTLCLPDPVTESVIPPTPVEV